MAITLNGNGTIGGLVVGGLPDGSVDADTLAANAVTAPKLATGVGGKVLQVLQHEKKVGHSQTTSGTTTYTIPDFSEAITMTSSSNKVLVHVSLSASSSASDYLGVYWWLNRTTSGSDNALAIGDQTGSNRGRGSRHVGRNYNTVNQNSEQLIYLDTPGAGTHTYDIKYKDNNGDGGKFYLNWGATDADTTSNVICCSTLILMEIAA